MVFGIGGSNKEARLISGLYRDCGGELSFFGLEDGMISSSCWRSASTLSSHAFHGILRAKQH